MNDWGARFDEALLWAMSVACPEAIPTPGERYLLVLLWPTFHAPVLIELIDLGLVHEMGATVIEKAMRDAAFDEASRRRHESSPSSTSSPSLPPPTWQRWTLPIAALAELRARLDGFVASEWPRLPGGGRDGLAMTVWLRDHRGLQLLRWSTATHELAGTPLTLACELLSWVEGRDAALQAACRDVRTYVPKFSNPKRCP